MSWLQSPDLNQDYKGKTLSSGKVQYALTLMQSSNEV